jgi:hypothetical protein
MFGIPHKRSFILKKILVDMWFEPLTFGSVGGHYQLSNPASIKNFEICPTISIETKNESNFTRD